MHKVRSTATAKQSGSVSPADSADRNTDQIGGDRVRGFLKRVGSSGPAQRSRSTVLCKKEHAPTCFIHPAPLAVLK